MDARAIIAALRSGETPSARELAWFARGLSDQSVSDAQAAELEAAATDWGMDALIEVHDAEELERATQLKSRMIGINNRNLKTFETTLDTTRQLSLQPIEKTETKNGMQKMKEKCALM